MAAVKKKKEWAEWRCEYAFKEFPDLELMRLRVEDCLQGQQYIKRHECYLPRTHWYMTHDAEYKAYVRRATFYAQTLYAYRLYEGLVMAGSPEILLPKDGRMDFLLTYATVYKGNLKSLQMSMNKAQFSAGLRLMLVEPTQSDDHPFVILEYGASSFLRAEFEKIDGESAAKFILMDESAYEFDRVTKKDVFKERLRVFGLDAKNNYYQCAITPDKWPSFNIDNPSDGGNDPKYPVHHGKKLHRIPVTWCNASSRSGSSIDIPSLVDMADLDLKLYELDANYAQHLYQSSQETVFFTHAPGDFDISKIYYGSGAQNALPGDMDVKVVSVNGIGFSEQREYMDDVKEQIAQKRMSIMSSKSHQASASVGLAQTAQTSPLRTIVLTAAEAITEQLRYIAEWIGDYSKEEIAAISYMASNEFAKIDTDLTSFVALCKAVQEGSVPMLESDLYRFAKDCGFINSNISWADFKKQHAIEMQERQDALLIQPVSKDTQTK